MTKDNSIDIDYVANLARLELSDEEKAKIDENFKNDLANKEVEMKIARSKEQNLARIERMKMVNELTESLKGEMKREFREVTSKDEEAYK